MQNGFFSFNSGPFFEDAIKNDKYLFEMAAYDATGGFIPTDHTQENLIGLQEEIAKKFNYFKKQIQSGETTIDELSKFIALKNGAYRNKKLTNEKIIDDVIIESRKSIAEPDLTSRDDAISIFKKLFQDMENKGISITTADKLFPQVETGEVNIDKIIPNEKPKKKKKGGLGSGLENKGV